MAAVQVSFSVFAGSLWSFWWRWLPHDCIHSVVLPLMFRRVSVAAMGYEHVWGKCLATVDELLELLFPHQNRSAMEIRVSHIDHFEFALCFPTAPYPLCQLEAPEFDFGRPGGAGWVKFLFNEYQRWQAIPMQPVFLRNSISRFSVVEWRLDACKPGTLKWISPEESKRWRA